MKIIIGLLFCLFCTSVKADYIFTKPITAIISVPVGGVHDLSSRLLFRKISEMIKQPIIPMNLDGASGITATNRVINYPADGYTWLVNFPQLTISAAQFSNKVDINKIKGISIFGNPPVVLSTSSDFKSIDDLKKTKVFEGCAGLGTYTCILNKMLIDKEHLNSSQVIYPSNPAAVLDMAGKRVDFTFAPYSNVKSYVDSGLINIIEIKGYELPYWTGILVHKNVSNNITFTIDNIIKQILLDPQFCNEMKIIGSECYYVNSEQFNVIIDNELNLYK
jgi:hypothetical protein